MGNSLRCCLACMLPCGALDVVRVVHLSSGHVDEFAPPLTAGDVLAAHPNHALTAAGSAGGARKIAIVSPDSELKRGRIYFLIPSAACSAPSGRRATGGGGAGRAPACGGQGWRALQRRSPGGTSSSALLFYEFFSCFCFHFAVFRCACRESTADEGAFWVHSRSM
ncbi:hypothetical protein PR202_ga05462 [Eleusine coracana subsp. coracana]|uniref:Uncharacterized protein n=1 Tax=Eleusine coracana subsp. coracana TaxID=191504 RepID=A0AAV5BSF5_ELECO|nr:hypothetical protein PR202_ga05009 [Eleusine coracana subsp. coracana]GJM89287.1 hypothetical protein PR202_ga05462 [Eleusine coracana subsp. coracana]